MAADGSDVRRLTFSPDDEYMPAWSPDGRKILYSRMIRSPRSAGLFLVNPDGSDSRPLFPSEFMDEIGDWSPDGSHIVFHSNRSNDYQIYVVSLMGGQLSRLTNGPGGSVWPRWR
jgi:TolB protein